MDPLVEDSAKVGPQMVEEMAHGQVQSAKSAEVRLKSAKKAARSIGSLPKFPLPFMKENFLIGEVSGPENVTASVGLDGDLLGFHQRPPDLTGSVRGGSVPLLQTQPVSTDQGCLVVEQTKVEELDLPGSN
ncbi:hypothetical protein SESBI_38282 [Sesbania bispinosa]|nr:hypothetical protein SESBI_38282 [Sesbania bispinosa]